MIKRKFKLLTSMIIFSLTLIGCFEREVAYKTGTYIGTSDGYYSEISVEVIVDDYNIIGINILDNEEPPTLSSIVFEELPPRIIKKNNTFVDVVSGATYTSEALLNAVENALENARETE